MIQDDNVAQIEIFRELSILGSPQLAADFMKRISKTVSGIWSPIEINPHEWGGNTFCFSCGETEEHPAAKLWFAKSHNKNKLYVSNIVPLNMNSLTKTEYNRILMEFYKTFIEPFPVDKGLEIIVEEDLVGLDHWLDEEAIRRLNSFSNCANKSTGTGHPLDERRWWLFCFYIHDKGFFSKFYPDILGRWLNEVLGWHEEGAHKLALNYERTLRTLEAYNEYHITGDVN
ncbi:MAG: hypothetical protein P4L53_24510 [Candidatus Obscuribacterales bacterium]|nr:hypothetical protein [Candidatus Obscuribacterales bacterium]